MKQKICYVIGAGENYGLDFCPKPDDYVIAADGGLPKEKLRTLFLPVSFKPTIFKVFSITVLSGMPRWMRCISIF